MKSKLPLLDGYRSALSGWLPQSASAMPNGLPRYKVSDLNPLSNGATGADQRAIGIGGQSPVPDKPKKMVASSCGPTFAEQCIGMTFRAVRT